MAALRFKLDENVARDAAALLREQSHDVQTVYEEQLVGEADPAILAACLRERRILVTLDLDFADVRRYAPSDTPGIIVLRPPAQTIALQLALLRQLPRILAELSPVGQLWVVEPGRVRARE